MSQLLKVSTKTGDKGESGLISGERLPKNNELFVAIGDVDELNSWLGLLAAKCGTQFAAHQQVLYEIQDTLFYLGAELAKSPKTKLKSEHITQLENESDALQTVMADGWHNKFLLPGGTELGGYLDVARTVCRRAERSVVGLSEQQPVRPVVLQYLNRLSDYLYVLRCFINHSLQYSEQQFAPE